jgi:hypothetical protein
MACAILHACKLLACAAPPITFSARFDCHMAHTHCSRVVAVFVQLCSVLAKHHCLCLQALQDVNLCSPDQLQKLLQTCEACGFDPENRATAAAVVGQADTLQQLLDK